VITPRRALGAGFLSLHRLGGRAHGKAFSLLAAGAFAGFGADSMLQPPIRLAGEARIRIGRGVFVGAGSWLQVLDGCEADVALSVGDGTSMAGGCVISAARSISLGKHVLVARNVYIADHQHSFEDTTRPVLAQGVSGVNAVEICDGAWLGENVVVGPGVRIGRGSVVGANAVVLASVPDYSVAVGAPARVVRSFPPVQPGLPA
jgi:carbonic anhydrase/acetyltransferase-like protein (isoleucine patch superfamily)